MKILEEEYGSGIGKQKWEVQCLMEGGGRAVNIKE